MRLPRVYAVISSREGVIVLITTVSVGGAIYDVIDRKKWRKEMEEDFMRHFGISQDTENVEE